ncbi:MAG: hypothetical protein QOI36_4148 [Pseudonocardiales bacterium]|jgi:hypothetical protein|nr:hypothetical protein [Pseudonocardia sp.]MDT7652742.1 hypothetical protein [Pseudonocardiales bacterium]
MAEVVQRVRPDVLLINELDHAPAAVEQPGAQADAL